MQMCIVSELNVIKKDLESKLGSEFQSKIQRARSLSESASESDVAAGKYTLWLFRKKRLRADRSFVEAGTGTQFKC